MTPPRGIVRPAIQGALTGLLVAFAAIGGVGRWLDGRTRPDGLIVYRCRRCRADCVRRPLP